MILIIVVLLGFCIIIINKNINNKNDSLPTINIYNDNNEIDYYVFETNWYIKKIIQPH